MDGLSQILEPGQPQRLATGFGGPDMKMIFFTVRTSIYSLRAKVPACRASVPRQRTLG